MSLSKRDTFVRWVDPMQIMWEDANGDVHLSLPDALKKFEIEDTPESRKKILEIVAAVQPHAKFTVREKPDSDDYYEQDVPRCEHEFIDSNTCAKCGWSLIQGGPMGGA